MQSINYYIQLSDSLSTRIDNMAKDELIAMAHDCLENYEIVYYCVDCSATQQKQATKFIQVLGLNTSDLVRIAYGCLAKATA